MMMIPRNGIQWGQIWPLRWHPLFYPSSLHCPSSLHPFCPDLLDAFYLPFPEIFQSNLVTVNFDWKPTWKRKCNKVNIHHSMSVMFNKRPKDCVHHSPEQQYMTTGKLQHFSTQKTPWYLTAKISIGYHYFLLKRGIVHTKNISNIKFICAKFAWSWGCVSGKMIFKRYQYIFPLKKYATLQWNQIRTRITSCCSRELTWF